MNSEIYCRICSRHRTRANGLFRGYSCLYRAAQYAHSEVVDLLLRHGADVNMAGRYVPFCCF